MRESSLYTALNLALSGRLDQFLLDARSEGKSFSEIAFDLRDETGIRVSYEWIRQQLSRLAAA